MPTTKIIQVGLILFFTINIIMLVIAIPKYSQKPTNFNKTNSSFDATYMTAKVLEVNEIKDSSGNLNTYKQYLSVVILDGTDYKKEIKADSSFDENSLYRKSEKGETIVLEKTVLEDPITKEKKTRYIFSDKYRLSGIYWIIAFFVVVVLVVVRKKGLMSLIGLVMSGGVLALYTVPRLVAGDNTLVVAMFSVLLIAPLTIYVSHGFNKQNTMVLISMILTTIVVANLGSYFLDLVRLAGVGSEDSAFLSVFGNINVRGLILTGIIISALGVLDDAAMTQSATISSLAHANPNLTPMGLYTRAMSVGGAHITSLVNSLLVVYAGNALTLLIILFATLQKPVWLVLNSETFAQQIMESIVVSSGLILTVPITTYLVAFFLSSKDYEKGSHAHHGHSH
jgi:uncharacterized membrane protein